MRKNKKNIICFLLSLVLIVSPLCVSEVFAYVEDPSILGSIYYNIKNVRSGQYLDVYNANTSDGTNVIQYKYHGNNNQKWNIVYLGGGLYKIVSALDTTKALTVASSTGANGLNIYISTFTNDVTQRFAMVRQNDTTYKILTNASNYIGAMTVYNASCNQGANVIQYTYNGTHNDEWLLEADSYYPSFGIRYARANWDNHLNTYPDLDYMGENSGNCANFVSQCLVAGGKKYEGAWYVYKNNNSHLIPQNIDELNDSWDLADPSPWISAAKFCNYWTTHAIHTDTFTPQQIINNDSATNTIYTSGTVVQLLKWHWLWGFQGCHTMYVTDAVNTSNKGTYKVTYQSNNSLDITLATICQNYNTSDYRVRFYLTLD